MKHSKKWAVVATGPVYFTEKILQYLKAPEPNYIDIFLPPTFFFPLTHTEVRINLEDNLTMLTRPETAAIHYWSGSWLKKGDNK
jgi:hypothetical protein